MGWLNGFSVAGEATITIDGDTLRAPIDASPGYRFAKVPTGRAEVAIAAHGMNLETLLTVRRQSAHVSRPNGAWNRESTLSGKSPLRHAQPSS